MEAAEAIETAIETIETAIETVETAIETVETAAEAIETAAEAATEAVIGPASSPSAYTGSKYIYYSKAEAVRIKGVFRNRPSVIITGIK